MVFVSIVMRAKKAVDNYVNGTKLMKNSNSYIFYEFEFLDTKTEAKAKGKTCDGSIGLKY